MSRSRGQGSGVRGQLGSGTLPAFVFLLCFFFFFAGCLGESSTDPPALPPGVTNISKTTAVSFGPSAASTSIGTIYVVWGDEGLGGDFDIFLSRSGDGGNSFSTPINVSNSLGFSGNPKIAISNDGNNIVHIVWEEFLPSPVPNQGETDIFYSRAVEDATGNLDFGLPKNLSISDPICGPPAGGLPCPSQVPTITTFDNHVFVAWMESTAYIPPDFGTEGSTFQLFNSDILMVRSSDHGASFPDPSLFSPEVLSLPNTGFTKQQSPSQNPSLAAANRQLFITWDDSLPVGQERQSKILFRTLVDINSPTPVYTPDINIEGRRLSDPIVEVNQPGIAAEANNVYLIFEGTDPLEADSEIFLIQSVNGGATFSSPTGPGRNISNNTGRSKKGRITVSGLNVFISWEDNSTGVPLVLFRVSPDGGVTFLPIPPDRQTLISSSSTVGNTAIAASGLNLFAFWEDALFGNFEIFFSRR